MEDLHKRLREAIENVETLRREAADLEADLRNHLHTLTHNARPFAGSITSR